MQSPRVTAARRIEQRKLAITFENGETRIFDMLPYLSFPVFKPLTDEDEFTSFSIVDGTIEWSCGADLSPDTFYMESQPLDSKAVM
jgi:hypothetical protein